jgi:hypothetical protein
VYRSDGEEESEDTEENLQGNFDNLFDCRHVDEDVKKGVTQPVRLDSVMMLF